jgi:hypothetical protein
MLTIHQDGINLIAYCWSWIENPTNLLLVLEGEPHYFTLYFAKFLYHARLWNAMTRSRLDLGHSRLWMVDDL